MSPFSVIKAYLTVIAWTSLFRFLLPCVLPQSGTDFIHYHYFPQLPSTTVKNQIKGKKNKIVIPTEYISSLFCLHSAPSFICSFSGLEEPLLRLQVRDSSRHKPGTHCILAAVPRGLFTEREAFQGMTTVALLHLRVPLSSLQQCYIALQRSIVW